MRLAIACAGWLAFAGMAAAAERNPFSLGDDASHVPVPTPRFPYLGGGGLAGRPFRSSNIPFSSLFSLNNPNDLRSFQEWLADYARRHPEIAAGGFDADAIRRMEEDLRLSRPRLWTRMQRLERALGAGRLREGDRTPLWARHVLEWVEAEIRADPSILSDPNLAPTIQRMLARLENRVKNPGLMGSAGDGRPATFLERWLDPESPDSPFSPESWLGERGEDILNRLSDLISAAPERIARMSRGSLGGRLRSLLGLFAGGGPEAGPAGTGGEGVAGPLGTCAAIALVAAAAAWILLEILRRRRAGGAGAFFPRPGALRPFRSRQDLIEGFLALSAYALQREFPALTSAEIPARAREVHPRAGDAFGRLAALFDTAYYHPDPARTGPGELSEAERAYREASEGIP